MEWMNLIWLWFLGPLLISFLDIYLREVKTYVKANVFFFFESTYSDFLYDGLKL